MPRDRHRAGTILTDADLTRATFRGARLVDCRLASAILAGCDLEPCQRSDPQRR